MIASTETKELYAALVKAQSEFKKAVKGTANPFFKSKYATLEEVQDATRDALSENGLAITQGGAGIVQGYFYVETVMIHASGQHIAFTMCAKPRDESAQTVVSLSTYLRRAGWASICGLAVTDDDGNEASGNVPNSGGSTIQKTFKGKKEDTKAEFKPEPKADDVAKQTNVVTDDHRAVAAELKRLAWPTRQQLEWLKNRYGASRVSDLSPEKTADALAWLKDVQPVKEEKKE